MRKKHYHGLFADLLQAACLSLLLAGCFSNTTRLRQDDVMNIAWKELEPSTSSQNRGNWEVVEVARVYGREVVMNFTSLQVSNCPGPTPPENGAIRSSSEYWFVRVTPRQRMSPTRKSTSASSPELIAPEPLFHEAQFLIDPFSGEIIARRLVCQRSQE